MARWGTLIFLFFVTFILTACGSKEPANKGFATAPMDESELGLIVTGMSYQDIDKLNQNYPEVEYRKISRIFKSYEVRGVDKEDILKINSKLTITKNKFIKSNQLNKLATDGDGEINFFQGDFLKGSEFSPQNCNYTKKLKVPAFLPIKMSGSSFKKEFYTQDTIKMFLQRDLEEKESGAWAVIPPDGSNLDGNQLTYTDLSLIPDMPGIYYAFFLLKKDGLCNYSRSIVPVTSNAPYEEDSANESSSFLQQVANVKLDQITETFLDALSDVFLNTDKEVVVAVIDSGVNYNHPSLHDKIWKNTNEIPENGLDDDNNGFIDDYIGYDMVFQDPYPFDDYGHGSHVSGLIAGKEIGIANKANIKIMPIKSGFFSSFDYASYIAGVEYAITNNADIINLSLGSNDAAPLEKKLLLLAEDQGIVIVAAAGNGDKSTGIGYDIDANPVYPASLPIKSLISVGSVETSDGTLTTYSNYGAKSVDIATVGGYVREQQAFPIYSAYIYNPQNISLVPNVGTSMATPIVAGAAALIKANYPKLTSVQIKEILLNSGNKMSSLEGKVSSGSVLNINQALGLASEY